MKIEIQKIKGDESFNLTFSDVQKDSVNLCKDAANSFVYAKGKTMVELHGVVAYAFTFLGEEATRAINFVFEEWLMKNGFISAVDKCGYDDVVRELLFDNQFNYLPSWDYSRDEKWTTERSTN